MLQNTERPEKRQTSARYRQHTIWSTSWGRYVVVIHAVAYPPCDTFEEATGIIDAYWQGKVN